MNKFLVTREFQFTFTDALKNDQLDDWYNCRIEQVKNIENFLKSLKIEGYGLETSVICKHLCDNFSKIHELFLQNEQSPKKNQLLRIGKFLSTLGNSRNKKDVIKEFNRKLMKYKQEKRWSKLFEYCKFYVDSILEQLRTQYHLDIRIEGDDGKIYYTFSDAEKKKNGRIKSEQFLNVRQQTSRQNRPSSKSLRERHRKVKETSEEVSIVPKSMNQSEIRRCRSAEELSSFSKIDPEVENLETKPEELKAQELIIKETRVFIDVPETLRNSETPGKLLEERIEQEDFKELFAFQASSTESVATNTSFEMQLNAQNAEYALKLLEQRKERENTKYVKKELDKLINSY